MPHNISNHSNRAELAYTGKDPWHGLGTKVPGLMTTKEALTASGTDWQVEKVPVLSSYDMTVIPNHHTIIRKDTNYPLGIVGERYTPISNSEALSFFDDVLGEGAGAIEVCGALGNGEKIFALARFPEKFEVVSNDEVHTFMLVSTSHDGSSCVEILYTPVRVVCQNTLTTALKGKGNRYRVRHTASYKQNITQAKNILNDSKEYWEKLKEASIYMSKTSVSRKEVENFVSVMFPDKIVKDEKGKERVLENKNSETFLWLIENGAGTEIPGVRGSKWGMYNAYTEYLDHYRTNRGKEHSWAKNVYSWESDRQKAFDLVLA